MATHEGFKEEEHEMALLLIQEDVPLDHLDLHELARRCRGDIRQYQQQGTPNARSANLMELFRRAITLRNDDAWSILYELFGDLVGSWVRTYVGGGEAVGSDYEEIATLVNAAFAGFSCAFHADHLARCSSVAAILRYLKLATRSTVYDELRRSQGRQCSETSLDALREKPAGESSRWCHENTEHVIGRLWAQELWQLILGELPDERERLLLTLLYVREMKPGEISDQYQRWFPTPEMVWRLKRLILERLLRNRRIQAFLHESPMTEPAATRRSGHKKARTPETRQAEKDLRQHLAQAAEVRQTREELLTTLEGGALQQARQELLAVLEAAALRQYAARVVPRPRRTSRPKEARPPGPQGQKVHLQMAFCGKARCLRCRNCKCGNCVNGFLINPWLAVLSLREVSAAE